MHLLAARQDDLTAEPQAVDLGLTPADLVVLSFSDSDLSALAAAWRNRRADLPSLRLVNPARLGHPLSVDLFIDRVVRPARGVVLRLLGGAGYWRYGLERVVEVCREEGIPLAVLPGDARPDPNLEGWSTVPAEAVARLWRLFVEGGPDNAASLLGYAATIAGHPAPWAEPAPVPRFGRYEGWTGRVEEGAPVAAVVFYRSHLLAGDVAPVHALADALAERGLAPLPLFAASLKEEDAAAWVARTLIDSGVAVVLNATGFSAVPPGGAGSPLDAAGVPVLQVVLSTGTEAGWAGAVRGLGPADLAMNVVLPEMDGRILTRAIAFKAEAETDPDLEFAPTLIRPVPDRVAWAADLAAAWVRLSATPRGERRLALVLSDYPGPGGGVGRAVGLDTPASAVGILDLLRDEGYAVADVPAAGADLLASLNPLPPGERVAAQPPGEGTGDTVPPPQPSPRGGEGAYFGFAAYRRLADKSALARIAAAWGEPDGDPLAEDGGFRFRVRRCGAVIVAVQPSRGHGPLTTAQHHDPDTPPSHGYYAFHLWLRHMAGIHALVQVGAHGTLEWLPGKAVALSSACWPEIVAGPLPILYPFIVNNPGEGAQARRRLGAVLIGHLTPPPMQAGLHGDLADLETAIDEYAQAAGMDPRRLGLLQERITDLAWRTGVAADCNLSPDTDPAEVLNRLDAHLCDVKEMQIRDGLHVFGTPPTPESAARLAAAIARFPHGRGEEADMALPRALALDLALDDSEHRAALDARAAALVAGEEAPDPAWTRTAAVLERVRATLLPAIAGCGEAERAALLAGLDGRFVPPGPGGSPARGRADTLPTGRNLFALDPRAVPTPTAWALGWKAADALLTRHLHDHGDWPRALVVDVWGTPTLRTGGDELAQALALLGVRPVWEGGSGRVTGYEIMPAGLLGRPRVDVTLRLSGLFRDVFPQQVALFDQAVRAVAGLSGEGPEVNPLAAAVARDMAELAAQGVEEERARRLATARVFGTAPGGYGTALAGLLASGDWSTQGDFGRAYLDGGCHAYGPGLEGVALPSLFRRRVGGAEALVHHQDQREHDLLSHDGHAQFEGGFAAAAASLGADPALYHLDSAEPDRLTVRTLGEELARVLRGRAANPRWIAGMMRHGPAGAADIAAAVDTLFAFAASTRVVKPHHFDILYDAYVEDERVLAFLRTANPAAARAMLARFADAMARGLWHPRRNAVGDDLRRLREEAA